MPETETHTHEGLDVCTHDAPEKEPPAYNPGQFDAPEYDEISSDDDLIAFSKPYVAVCIAHYDLDVDAGHIAHWSVTHRSKRTAAKVRHVDLSQLGVFTASGLTKPDWESLQKSHNHKVKRAFDHLNDVKDVEVRLSFDAYEAFTRDEWLDTLRHELAHICQFHQHGAGGHGFDFEQRARDLSTDVNCPQFSDYKYEFACSECGCESGGRHQRSKAVKFAELSPEQQDEWVESGESYWTSNCCNAFLTLRE